MKKNMKLKNKGIIIIDNPKSGCPNLTKKDIARIEKSIDNDKELIKLIQKLAKE